MEKPKVPVKPLPPHPVKPYHPDPYYQPDHYDDVSYHIPFALSKSIYFSFLLCALLNSEHKVLELKAVCTCWEYTILVEKYEQLVEKNCLIAK